MKYIEKIFIETSQEEKKHRTEFLLRKSFKKIKEFFEDLLKANMSWFMVELDHLRPLSQINRTVPEQLGEASHFSKKQTLMKSDSGKKVPNFLNMN